MIWILRDKLLQILFDENLGKHNKYSNFRDSPENWKSIMSRGTIDIYEYLHEKVLSEKNPQSNMASKTLSNQMAFGENGIEFRKCRMILAIQNESQLQHAKLCYPIEDKDLLKDTGRLNINQILTNIS